jgi:CheY-like chemotaxis protein
MDTILTGKTILVIEDNIDDVFFLRRILKKAGLEDVSEFVGDGEEAIQYLEQRLDASGALPRLVLLDLNMPRVNGFELTVWVRAEPRLECLLMAAMTSSSYEMDVEKAYAAGIHVYLLKYPSPEDLRELARIATTMGPAQALATAELPGIRRTST